MAGATLLAFGNGSPDIFSTIASVQQNEIGQAIGSSVGGGMFVTSIVVSLVVLASKKVVPKVSSVPFLRDILFYILAILLLFSACIYGKVFVWGSALFLLIYVAYVLTIIISRYMYKKKKEETISMVSIPGFQAQTSKFLRDSEFKIEEDYVTDNKLSNLAFADSSFAFDKAFLGSDSDEQEEEEENTDSSSKVFFGKIGLFMKKKKNKSMKIQTIQAKEYSLLDEENIPVATLDDGDLDDNEEDEEIEIKTVKDSLKFNFIRFLQLIEWEEKSIPKKIFTIIEFPRFLIQSLCIPSGDEDGYFRPFYIAHPFVITLFGLTVFRGWKMHGGFLPGPIWPYFLVISLIFSVIIYLSTNDQKPPAYEWIFIFLSMILSIMWIYFTAEELVSLLSSAGTLLNISTTIMGLTVLTWGNSVGDLVSNSIISSKGFPQMAISASYCAPLTNMLLGLGLSFTISSITKRAISFSLAGHLRSGLFFSFLFLLFNLISTIVMLVISKFKYKKFYPFILISIYISFTTIALLTESGIIKVKLWRV